MKKERFTVGEKISSVLRWPQLQEGDIPMHILLEVVEGEIEVEGVRVPKTKAIAVSPIEIEEDIIALLKRNDKYVPNRLRLRAYELHKELTNTFEALEYLQRNTVDVGIHITEEAERKTREVEKRKEAEFYATHVPFMKGGQA